MPEVVELLNQTQAFLDTAEYVERYAWFGAFPNLGGVNPVSGLSQQLNDYTQVWC